MFQVQWKILGIKRDTVKKKKRERERQGFCPKPYRLIEEFIFNTNFALSVGRHRGLSG